MYRMYGLIASASILIRNFCLPNPFERLEFGVLINLIIEPFLQIITYGVVGLFYRRGSAPALGSLLYLFFYIAHIGLIFLCGKFNFAQEAIIIIIALYIAILVGLVRLVRNRLDPFSI